MAKGRGGQVRGVAVLCAVALLAAGGCSRGGASAARPTLALSPCLLDGVSEEVRCGTLEVFEDRAAKAGRKISLRVAVIPALAQSPEPDPVFVLAGGPGQAASEVAKVVLPMLERLHRRRDLVFVDQRGTGGSAPLACEEPTPEQTLSSQLSEGLDVDLFKRCLGRYAADVRHYTTPVAMDDLDDVRAALGYAQVNLWGASYGTRAGLVYLRQHPDRVRTAVLDGVYPVDMKLPLTFAKDAQRALDLLFAHCEQEEACRQTFPALEDRFEALRRQIEKAPPQFHVAHPVTGADEEIILSSAGFAATLRGLLYLPETASLMPLTLDRASRGDFAPFVAQAQRLSSGFSKGLSLGMFFSVICSEDAPVIDESEIGAQTQGTFLGDTLTRELLKVCAIWPRGQLPDGYRAPVRSQAPTLLLSGELDPVTPPAHAEAAKATLPNSLHVVVPGVGHGASGQGCVPRLIAQLVETGTVANLDVECTRKLGRPPFFVTFAGPRP